MKSVKSDAITWIINDKISVTFHGLRDHPAMNVISVFPSDTIFKLDTWDSCMKFNKCLQIIPGYMACTPLNYLYVDDGKQTWKCTRDGVTLENQHKKLCEYFMDNRVIFEFDGNSTYLLLKDKREPLTHSIFDWEKMVGDGSLNVVHASGHRRLAQMIKETHLPISAEYEKTLLEACK